MLNRPCFIAFTALALAACGSTTGADGGSGGGGGTTCDGTPGAGTRNETPTEHRATAKTCLPSTTAPAADAGLLSCAADADCTGDGGTALYTHCVRGTCSFDECLDDSDCSNGACGCSTDYYGGNGHYHPNLCVPSNCRTDADCGSGGFCSPSRGYCGVFEGFYCHTAQDTCVNAQLDCQSCPVSGCVYQPTVGSFSCGGSACSG